MRAMLEGVLGDLFRRRVDLGGYPRSRASLLPVTVPFLRAVLEDLQQGRSHVVLGVQPGEWDLRIERRTPFEAAVFQQLHLEERVGQAGEVVVVDAGVDEGGGHAELADVVLDGELGRPLRDGGPGSVDGMIRHAAVDVVLDGAGAFGGVGQIPADGDLVAGLGGGVDEGELGALEQLIHQRDVAEQRALQEGDIGQLLQFGGNHAFQGVDLRAHRVPHGRRDTDQRRCLSAGPVDDGNGLLRLCHPGGRDLVWEGKGIRSSGEGNQREERDKRESGVSLGEKDFAMVGYGGEVGKVCNENREQTWIMRLKQSD